jgi:hypothetical protein
LITETKNLSEEIQHLIIAMNKKEENSENENRRLKEKITNLNEEILLLNTEMARMMDINRSLKKENGILTTENQIFLVEQAEIGQPRRIREPNRIPTNVMILKIHMISKIIYLIFT